MQRFELLHGARVFWERARGDVLAARRRVYLQAMTFEGDGAGQSVAEAVIAAGAGDRKVLVDDYTRWNLSDRSLIQPFWRLDPALRREADATAAMFRSLLAAGVGVRRTNPVGPLFIRFPARNHKKLIVADDVTWLGGVNFSDHNFAWDDLMLRIADPAAADWLAADFSATYASSPRAGRLELNDLTLLSLDGRYNRAGFAPVMELIDAAKTTIAVVSPYLTHPFTGALVRAAGRGVAVTLITPADNNKPIVAAALARAGRRGGFDVRLTPGMSHLKALLLDDETLVIGSANFDCVSLAAEEELLAVCRDGALIADFRDQVLAPTLERASAAHLVAERSGLASQMLLYAAESAARVAGLGRRRTVDWT